MDTIKIIKVNLKVSLNQIIKIKIQIIINLVKLNRIKIKIKRKIKMIIK